MDFVEYEARTVESAITKASIDFGLTSDQLEIEVVSRESKGFLGIGNKPAVIKVRKKTDEFKEEKTVGNLDSVKEIDTIENKSNIQNKKQTHKNYENDEKENEPVVKFEKREIPVRSEEEINEIIESAESFLKSIFKSMNLEVIINSSYNPTEGCLEVDFSGEGMGVLIGKRGQTLDSLQYLTSLVVNKNQKDYVRVKLDTENYRARRRETLENLAKNIASKVKKTRKTVVLEPMNPYERRIIHSTLQKFNYVETYSEGNEPYRHVVVSYKR